VVLNADGVCNYCTFLEQNQKAMANVASREPLLASRLEKNRGKYAYDAVVGLSGGKDSTYVACQMVLKYKLKVLAVTYDNGFLTDYARASIENTIKKLNLDHFYYKPDWEIHKKFYKATVQKMFDPCIACAFGGYFLSIKGCYERKIPFFVHGRTPFQMYRNFYAGTNDLFLPMMKANLMPHSFAALAPVYGAANEYMRQVVNKIALNPEDAKDITREFFVDSSNLTPEFVPEFLAYFLFEEYDEEKNKQYLEREIGWKRPSGDDLLGHYDCALHDAAGYMFKALNGVDVIEPDVAVMIRLGKISREEAQGVIRANQPAPVNIEKSMDALCGLCGFKREQLNFLLQSLKQANVSKFSSR
jgi:hypothetical protein